MAKSLFPLWSGTTVKLNDRTLKCWQVFPTAFAQRIFFFFVGNSGSDWQAFLPTKLCKRRFPLYQNSPKIWVGGYFKRCISLSNRCTVIVFGNPPHTHPQTSSAGRHWNWRNAVFVKDQFKMWTVNKPFQYLRGTILEELKWFEYSWHTGSLWIPA